MMSSTSPVDMPEGSSVTPMFRARPLWTITAPRMPIGKNSAPRRAVTNSRITGWEQLFSIRS
jgi:hypothetical protein